MAVGLRCQSTMKALSHLSGQTTRPFYMHGFSITQKKFCGQTDILQVLRVLPASNARYLRVCCECSTWHACEKIRVRYGQYTCTAWCGRVNSVVYARELCASCEGTWIYKNEHFPRYRETIYQYWEMKTISRYCRKLYGFTDAGNYLRILEMTFWYR